MLSLTVKATCFFAVLFREQNLLHRLCENIVAFVKHHYLAGCSALTEWRPSLEAVSMALPATHFRSLNNTGVTRAGLTCFFSFLPARDRLFVTTKGVAKPLSGTTI